MTRLALLLLPSAIAAAQLSLLWRAGQGASDFQVISLLVWFCAGVLWLEQLAAARDGGHRWRRWAPLGLLPLIWSLLVISRPYTVYDPLLNAVPLTTLLGMVLLLRGGPSRNYLLLGLLPLLHYGLIGLIATEPLEAFTASVSGFLLWLAGTSVVVQGNQLLLPGRVVEVAMGCTSLNAQSLGLSTVIALLALNGPLPPPRLLLLLGASPLLAFSVNATRVAVLALTSGQRDPHLAPSLTGFDYWHSGAGSSLFSVVLVLLLFGVEHLLRSAPAAWDR
ncbi:MAG: archaeosortase/exosortase family protein [Cyanobium sp.]|nr:archaeosortase/exosortase family protein [Cyanobium sp.]